MRYFVYLILLHFLASLPCLSLAHEGGLDKWGCHYNRKQGSYHCHRGPGAGMDFPIIENIQDKPVKFMPPPEGEVLTAGRYQGKVMGIIDAITLNLKIGHQLYDVLLAEIEAPGKFNSFAKNAKQMLFELVFAKTVTVDVQRTDRLWRSVARVYVDDLDVCAEMVRLGAARVDRKHAEDMRLFELEREAIKAKRGLWATPERESMAP